MITYELCLLLKIAPKPELTTVLKRCANVIFEKGGIIRKINNLGTQDIPHKISAHGLVHKQASYFVFEFNAPPSSLEKLSDEYARDVDIVRRNIYKNQPVQPFECTLFEELLPPPYRKNVQELVQQARKADKPKYDYKTGLNYYPFQK